MVFSSPIFLFIFFPLVFLLSRLIPGQRAKNAMLAAASLVFYAFGQLRYLPLFLASVVINYSFGVLLQRASRARKALLAAAVALNLGILGFFKYTDFVLMNLGRLFGAALPQPGILLPIGISFFTFQGLSYVIDVYRDPGSGTKDFLKLLLYISFFPQLIAGPIVKYHDVAEQIDRRSASAEDVAVGLRRFCLGLAKKVLIANAVGAAADAVFNRAGGAGDWRLAWLGAVCYLFQIYYDFSGYSDMAIGMGRAFGFRFLENFRHPYAAVSIRDFWRRWHISLSSWFKEYLYIPLGGNRRGKLRTALNKLIVFFCTGIWHGANWTFLFWGLGHGLLSSLEDALGIPADRKDKSLAGRLVGWVYTMLAVMLLFVIFRAPSLSSGFAMIASMFSGHTDPAGYELLRSLCSPALLFTLALALLFAFEWPEKLPKALRDRGLPDTACEALGSFACLCLYVLSAASLASGGFNPFIYFQF